MNKKCKNEAINLDVSDIIRYNEGYLLIATMYASGTQWYIPFPVYRTKIDANLAGQKLLSRIK